MRAIRNYFLAALVMVVVGCAALGVPSADTFREKLASGYTSVSYVRQGATVLNEAKAISLKDAENLLEQTDAAREGLDVAAGLEGLPGANDRLTATIKVLEALKAYLKQRGYDDGR